MNIIVNIVYIICYYVWSGPLSSPSGSFDFSALEEDAINRTKTAKLLAPLDTVPATAGGLSSSTSSSTVSGKYSNVKGIAAVRASYDTKPSAGGNLVQRSVSMNDTPPVQGSVAARSIAYSSVKGKSQLQVRH